MAVGDAYKLDLFQTFAGQRIMNTLYFERLVEPDPILADAFDLASDWMSFLKTLQVVQVSHTGWKIRQVRGGTATYPTGECRLEGGIGYEGLYTPPSVGTQVGEGLPPQAAMVTTLTTGFAGRRRRGRFFLGGLAEGLQTDGTFAAGTVSGAQTGWNGQMAQFGPAGSDGEWQWIVWSQRIATGCSPAAAHPHSPTQVEAPNPADASKPVTGTIVRNIVYSQRKRTIGVGA